MLGRSKVDHLLDQGELGSRSFKPVGDSKWAFLAHSVVLRGHSETLLKRPLGN